MSTTHTPHTFADYVPAPLLGELNSRLSDDFIGVPGLRIVGGTPPEYAEFLTVPALQYVVDVFEATLNFEHGLDDLMTHRAVKRACINERAKAVAAGDGELQNVELPDGTTALGYRADLAHIRDDDSWSVIDIPEQFRTFHDTITGPPTAPIVVNALKSGVSFFMVDFEDSSTVAFENVMDGIACVTQANRRDLVYTRPNGKTYTITPEDNDKLGEMIVRFEGLHLPNPHFIYKGVPLPAHVVTVALYTYHNWEPLARLNKLPSFYVPKLESYEEACYVANLFRSCRDLLPDPVAKEQMSHLSCFVIIENVFSVYQKEEILYALRDYIVGLNCGWHDYMASIGAVHQELPEFTMPPKSNLRIVVEHLEAYQAGIAEVCKRRGALPIGGMNAMVPPKAATTQAQKELDGDVEGKIRDSFSSDFWAQVARGLEGVWLAHKNLAPVAKDLIRQMEEQGRPEFKLSAPITHDKMLVTHLKIPVYGYAEFERNIADAVQYLASYLTGAGSVGLTATFKDGGRVRLMEDAATLERSRRELWSIARFGKQIEKEDGTLITADAQLVRETVDKVTDDVIDAGASADVPYTSETAAAYEAAKQMVVDLTTDPNPVAYFTSLAVKYLIKPFRRNHDLMYNILDNPGVSEAMEAQALALKDLALSSASRRDMTASQILLRALVDRLPDVTSAEGYALAADEPSSFAIKSTRILTSDGFNPGIVVVVDGVIDAILDIKAEDELSEKMPVENVGDVVVMTGLVDSHVHINEPGRTEWEGFDTATKAAGVGGITTVVDMPLNCIPVTTTADALAIKLAAAKPRIHIDTAFWGGVVPDQPELAELAAAGVVGAKAFTCHSGIDEFPASDRDTLREAMTVLKAAGIPLLVHAELDSVPLTEEEAADAAGPTSEYKSFLASRPKSWEDAAITMIIELCRETGCSVHIVHLSSGSAVPLLAAAKAEGLPITVESCPHYLCLTAEEIKAGRTEFKCCPPIREAANREKLWDALREGVIDIVVSDHSPCTPALKVPDVGDFMEAWGGIASLQLGLSAIWTEASKRGFELTDIIQWMAAAPAKLASLSDRKGALEVGNDADIILFDPDMEWTVTTDVLRHRHKVSPWIGRRLKGKVLKTWLRGGAPRRGRGEPILKSK